MRRGIYLQYLSILSGRRVKELGTYEPGYHILQEWSKGIRPGIYFIAVEGKEIIKKGVVLK